MVYMYVLFKCKLKALIYFSGAGENYENTISAFKQYVVIVLN